MPEELDSWLKDAFQADSLSVDKITVLDGGAVQENSALDVTVQGGPHDGRHRWALRKQPPSPLIGSWPKDHELTIIQAAYDAGVPVPKPLALCMDGSIIGAPFIILEFLDGFAGGRRIVRDPVIDDMGPALASEIGEAMAKLHSVTPPNPALNFIELGGDRPVNRRIRLYREQLDLLDDRHPVLEFVLSWLDRHQPAEQRYTLIHNDFRTGNYMIRDGKLAGILDWEIADWGDPREDLGYFCAKCWRFGNIHKEAGGIAPRAALYDGYNAATEHPVEIDGSPFWEVMGAMRWAVIALLQGHRHLSGEQRSLELALTPRIVPEMELDMLNLIEGLKS
ncbi:MAG: phosphotransferase family protein [Rhodospirillales bacterium]|nr:phosphotransferase family protein [Rhodospirillales bacterium]MBT4041855.1 phosphotransferase family protein [Rhodospirillales bacterium]MBT4626807.1 phosphotransferase family protein [Rhodospirillales bacterium]MBT5351057.1 phosphotransferase family protein [Rhodospirillales bacterium]MBT5521210.1 phosphotransferase family protein [Rhodospirillales bacterium]